MPDDIPKEKVPISHPATLHEPDIRDSVKAGFSMTAQSLGRFVSRLDNIYGISRQEATIIAGSAVTSLAVASCPYLATSFAEFGYNMLSGLYNLSGLPNHG